MSSYPTTQKLLTKEDCEKILTRSLTTPAHLTSYKISKYSANVAGFLGDHLKLTIKYTTNNIPCRRTYFVKAIPQVNLKQLEYVLEAGIFRKEVILYQYLLTELEKIGKFGPQCYFVKDNVIVLEDLKARGFTMLQKQLFLDQEHCEGLLKTLARYHASTLVYEKRKCLRLDQKFKEEIKETCFCFTEGQPRYKWLLCTTQCVIDLIKLQFNNVDVEDVCAKYKKFVLEEIPSYLAPSKEYRNVMTHDDLWCNNLLFNDQKECLFVDFQLTRYAPPGFDFLVTLYLNLDCVRVEKDLKKFVEIYHRFLVEELERHGLDQSELPLEEFEKSVGHYRLAALTESIMYGTHIFISEELANHIVEDFNSYTEFSFVDRSKFAVKEFNSNPQYRDRLSPVLSLLVDALVNRG